MSDPVTFMTSMFVTESLLLNYRPFQGGVVLAQGDSYLRILAL